MSLPLQHQAAARRVGNDVVPLPGVAARAWPRARERTRARRRRLPFDCSGRPQQPWRRDDAPGRRCARAPRPPSRRRRLVVVRARSRGSRRRPGRLSGGRRRRAHAWNVRPAQRGIGASRWMPSTRSQSGAKRRLRTVRFASGATGVPSCRARSAARSAGCAAVSPAPPTSRPRLRVDLRDLHAVRADLRADAAAGAVVDDASATASACRGTARPAARRTSARGRAASPPSTGRRLADRALDAVVERVARELGHGAPSRIAAAAA